MDYNDQQEKNEGNYILPTNNNLSSGQLSSKRTINQSRMRNINWEHRGLRESESYNMEYARYFIRNTLMGREPRVCLEIRSDTCFFCVLEPWIEHQVNKRGARGWGQEYLAILNSEHDRGHSTNFLLRDRSQGIEATVWLRDQPMINLIHHLNFFFAN